MMSLRMYVNETEPRVRPTGVGHHGGYVLLPLMVFHEGQTMSMLLLLLLFNGKDVDHETLSVT